MTRRRKKSLKLSEKVHSVEESPMKGATNKHGWSCDDETKLKNYFEGLKPIEFIEELDEEDDVTVSHLKNTNQVIMQFYEDMETRQHMDEEEAGFFEEQEYDEMLAMT